MGPERKEKLGAASDSERESQQLEELLLTSKRLVEEMQALTQRAKLLAEQHIAVVESIAAAKKR